MSKTEFKLTKPVESGDGDMTSVLYLRELTTKDIIKHGYPFTIYRQSGEDGGSVDTRIQPNVIMNYAVDLAEVPRSTIRSLSLEDFMRLQEVVMDFFGGTGKVGTASSKQKTASSGSDD